MLIGLLESDQSGRRTLTYDSTTRSFVLEGAGDIQPAKLIDLANRQQILWTDRAVRDWALRTAGDLLKEANARSSRARTAAAAVSLASGDGLISSATPPPAATKVRHAWTWAIVAALCVTFVGLGTAYHADIRHQLAAAFSRQPTPYIELYFTIRRFSRSS